MPLHSYPWYVSDWRESRTRLRMTMEQRGLYREVLDVCYRDGSVPNDEEVLQGLCGCSEKVWRRAWPAVRQALIELPSGDLTHHRVQDILGELLQYAEQRRSKGQSAAKKRWDRQRAQIEERAGIAPRNATGNATGIPDGNDLDATGNATGIAPAMPHRCPSPASSSSSSPATTTTTSVERPWDFRFDCAEHFARLWELYPAKGRTKRPDSERLYSELMGPLHDEERLALHQRIEVPVHSDGKWTRSEHWAKGFVFSIFEYLRNQRWLEEPVQVKETAMDEFLRSKGISA